MVNRMWAEMKCTFPVPAREKIAYFIPSVPPSFSGKLGSYILKLGSGSYKLEGGWIPGRELPMQKEQPFWTLYDQKVFFFIMLSH